MKFISDIDETAYDKITEIKQLKARLHALAVSWQEGRGEAGRVFAAELIRALEDK